MRRAATIAALGAGQFDGEVALLAFGSSETQLRWNLSAARWRSRSQPTIKTRGDWRMRHPTFGTVLGSWYYIAGPEGNPGQIGQSSNTWNPYSIRDADAAYAAGLHVQDNLAAVWWNFTTGQPYDLAIVRYAVADGDMISTLATPAPNVSVFVTSGNGVRKWQTTGWVDSAIPTPAKPILAPHLYSRFTVANGNICYLERVLASWRWSS